ncbi:MAG TPA: hypothetical protein PLU30_23695 [Verrucomicrobiae bacterium]|nr:hypothetical protein [Verrucomicrobiae bacterium]
MTYHLSLKVVAIILGLLGMTGGLIAALRPAAVRHILIGLPRNFRAGAIAMGIATLWTDILIYNIDLTEMTQYRAWLLIFFAVLGLMTIIYLPDFLFSRAMGVLLLLGAEVLFSATFPALHPARHIVTIVGYVWAIAGMCFVVAPYLLRDLINFFHGSDAATRRTGAIKAAFGLLLIALGITCF